jgi:hypothetical protein
MPGRRAASQIACIDCIVLVALHERLDIGWRDKAHLMAELRQLLISADELPFAKPFDSYGTIEFMSAGNGTPGLRSLLTRK